MRQIGRLVKGPVVSAEIAGLFSARDSRCFIPDFSHWKARDADMKAFDRLLDDLHGRPDLASI